jgi:RNase P subunit RPR2
LKEPKSKTLTCKHCGTPFDTYDTLFQRVIENHPLKKEDKAGIIQKGGDVKSTPQNSIRKRSDKDGDVESAPQITTRECGKRERFVRKGALNDALNQTKFFPEGSEQHDLLNFFANSKSDVVYKFL